MTTPLDRPTNSKGYARLLVTRIFSNVRETGRVMPPLEYKALAHEAGLNDSQLDRAIRELKREYLVALDNTTQGIRLTPEGIRQGDFWRYKAATVLNSDPMPESLEEIRAELQYVNNELASTLPGTPEWKWLESRRNLLMHRESIMVQETKGTVYVLSGPGARVNVNSTDNSTTWISISEVDVFPKLRSELNAKVADPARRQEIIEGVNELEQARGSSTYAEKFTSFLSSAADVMTIISPFITVLAALK
jgi:hypothetical protein